ncbi:MAG: DUF389 domain-containing protein [Porcipelethomonas sp.]
MKEKFRQIFSVRDNMMSHEEIHRMMIDNTRISGSNMCILMLAIAIASIGLNTNSTAVIIGAMLISPLMSGIITMGYSVAVKDLSMLWHALGRFAIQVFICLFTSTAYFAISPLSASTSELIARIHPTIWDVLIAVCGGLAGMIGCTRKEKTNVIPGVAIATALMPPLCTAGYGIGTGQPDFFVGAIHLFFVNTLFIAITSGIVTKALGISSRTDMPEKRIRKLNRKIVTLVIFAVVPCLAEAAYTVYSSSVEMHIKSFVETELVGDELMIVKQEDDIYEKTVTLAVIGREISDAEEKELNSKLADYNLEDFSLKIVQNT